MSEVIRISESTFKRLESLARGFDTPGNVIERLLDLYEKHKNISLPPRKSLTTATGIYTRKSISSFSFQGSKYVVRFWKDLLIKLCEVINAAHRNEFEKTLNIVGRKRPYFSVTGDELRTPQKIDNSKIYVETNLNANRVAKICFAMLSTFGYRDTDLRIEAN